MALVDTYDTVNSGLENFIIVGALRRCTLLRVPCFLMLKGDPLTSPAFSPAPAFPPAALVLKKFGYTARGIRLDSGDLAYLSKVCRSRLPLKPACVMRAWPAALSRET